jgi:hypothetical protein
MPGLVLYCSLPVGADGFNFRTPSEFMLVGFHALVFALLSQTVLSRFTTSLLAESDFSL